MRRLHKTIEEIGWTRNVPRLDADASVTRAFDAMSRDAHDCVLVISGSEIAGIFTSRDFLYRIAAERRDPGSIALREVMTRAPRTLRPRDGVAYAINWMAIEGFRNVPIVDDRGTVLGVLTVWDVMRHLDAVFADIEATPRPASPQGDTSDVIHMVDLGGGG